ncbi:zinc finger zim17-type [Diplodia corticola]|uniref:Zinc finger zim17-type n=1 Tax=Diplodia corticola TaxID=236234 RepID=A0A1J9S9A1_9PEZI|nr:zinc finger zim17-type [Diplodia corticola]OJD37079.1 zinc finger zim17-type [Diplodia corticola]
MINVEIRLRRAIRLNDLVLVRRIVRSNPHVLRNPDFEDKSNTSLHLAARDGFTDIAAFLIDAGHENDGISRNTDHDTPLMLAASCGQVEVGILLAARFPQCVPYINNAGMDVLMHASKNGSSALLPHLLSAPYPCSPLAHDNNGNTALHHASAAGELKCLRLLLQAGASPHALNAYAWNPLAYSRTQAAKLYFDDLVTEQERARSGDHQQPQRGKDAQQQAQQQAQQAARREALRSNKTVPGGIRLVQQDTDLPPPPATPGDPNASFPRSSLDRGPGMPRSSLDRGPGAVPLPRTSLDRGPGAAMPPLRTSFDRGPGDAPRSSLDRSFAGMPLPPPLRTGDWSPVERRRPMTPKGSAGGGTPTMGQSEWSAARYHSRARAQSGD